MNNVRVFCISTFKAFCDNEQSSSEYAPSVLGMGSRLEYPGRPSFFTGTPPRHSYHSHRVIVRSASPKRYTGKWRTLARAPSNSLTTRILANGDVTLCNAGRVGKGLLLMIEPTADQKLEHLRSKTNSKETEVQSLKDPNRVKAVVSPESKGNSFLQRVR